MELPMSAVHTRGKRPSILPGVGCLRPRVFKDGDATAERSGRKLGCRPDPVVHADCAGAICDGSMRITFRGPSSSRCLVGGCEQWQPHGGINDAFPMPEPPFSISGLPHDLAVITAADGQHIYLFASDIEANHRFRTASMIWLPALTPPSTKMYPPCSRGRKCVGAAAVASDAFAFAFSLPGNSAIGDNGRLQI